jgi:hypothetical protein
MGGFFLWESNIDRNRERWRRENNYMRHDLRSIYLNLCTKFWLSILILKEI